MGRGGWNKTYREHMEEHYGVSSGKEMAKRTDVEKVG
jgi:hypothetical protein